MIDVKSISTHCTRTEFVGTTVLDTIGLVISGIDDTLLKEMNVGTKYHALGLFSSRTGAAGQITAIDDAVKATNTDVLSIEFPRDTKGWGGHGNYIVIGGNDVSDVRHAIELALELTKKNAGELYISESGVYLLRKCRRCITESISCSTRRSVRIHGRLPGCNRPCDGGHRNEGIRSKYYLLYDPEHRNQSFQ